MQISEIVLSLIWLYDGSITAERIYNGQLRKREIYFGRQFDSFKVSECDVLGTVFWDEFNKELTVSPLIITDIIFEKSSYFSGKKRRTF